MTKSKLKRKKKRKYLPKYVSGVQRVEVPEVNPTPNPGEIAADTYMEALASGNPIKMATAAPTAMAGEIANIFGRKKRKENQIAARNLAMQRNKNVDEAEMMTVNNSYQRKTTMNPEQFVAADGAVFTNPNAEDKLVEVEKDELIFRKFGPNYRLIADFKGGKRHDSGGEDYIAKVGDIIFPGKKRNKIKKLIDNQNNVIDSLQFEAEVDKLPKEQDVPKYALGGIIAGAALSTTGGIMQGVSRGLDDGDNSRKMKKLNAAGLAAESVGNKVIGLSTGGAAGGGGALAGGNALAGKAGALGGKTGTLAGKAAGNAVQPGATGEINPEQLLGEFTQQGVSINKSSQGENNHQMNQQTQTSPRINNTPQHTINPAMLPMSEYEPIQIPTYPSQPNFNNTPQQPQINTGMINPAMLPMGGYDPMQIPTYPSRPSFYAPKFKKGGKVKGVYLTRDPNEPNVQRYDSNEPLTPEQAKLKRNLHDQIIDTHYEEINRLDGNDARKVSLMKDIEMLGAEQYIDPNKLTPEEMELYIKNRGNLKEIIEGKKIPKFQGGGKVKENQNRTSDGRITQNQEAAINVEGEEVTLPSYKIETGDWTGTISKVPYTMDDYRRFARQRGVTPDMPGFEEYAKALTKDANATYTPTEKKVTTGGTGAIAQSQAAAEAHGGSANASLNIGPTTNKFTIDTGDYFDKAAERERELTQRELAPKTPGMFDPLVLGNFPLLSPEEDPEVQRSNLVTPQKLDYVDRSDPQRAQTVANKEANRMLRRNTAGGNMQAYTSGASQDEANQIQQLQQINAREAGIANQIANQNVGIENQARYANNQITNRDIVANAQNRAAAGDIEEENRQRIRDAGQQTKRDLSQARRDRRADYYQNLEFQQRRDLEEKQIEQQNKMIDLMRGRDSRDRMQILMNNPQEARMLAHNSNYIEAETDPKIKAYLEALVNNENKYGTQGVAKYKNGGKVKASNLLRRKQAKSYINKYLK